MTGTFTSRAKARRRREWLLIGAAAAMAFVTLIAITPAVQWATSGAGFGRRALTTAREAAAIAEVLGDHPTDDRLIEAIKDPAMQGRQLAIEFLGEGGYGDALPVLDAIVRDPAEPDRLRVAALEASFLIARYKGRLLAREFQNDPVLGASADTILHNEDAIRNRPSRVQTLINLAP